MGLALEDYKGIVENKKINEIKSLAKMIKGKRVLMINSTRVGGGVAELLYSYISLFNNLKINTKWKTIQGNDAFFNITKKIHNALQGEKVNITDSEWDFYLTVNQLFAKEINEEDYDIIVIHDPQPLPLILYKEHTVPWIARLHIDLSSPYLPVWKKILQILSQYDGIVVSSKEYTNNEIDKSKTKVILPAIDPLNTKNMFISKEKTEYLLTKFGIDISKPIISQISRYDKWKDPIGVINIFEIVRKYHNAQLVILGNEATDDPEGKIIYNNVIERIKNSPYKKDIFALSINDELLVNALQRRSDVIIQKSIKEGFGLVVSEAMYKYNVVIASNVGGIKLQIDNNKNGFLLDPYDYNGFAEKIIFLLENKDIKTKMGIEANKKVINNFLITRLLEDWINLLIEYLY